MDYLLDSYIFKYIPFVVDPGTRKKVIAFAMRIIVMADWCCKARELQTFMENHASLFVGEIVYAMLWLLTLYHAVRHGTRYMYTWVGIYCLGFFVESTKFIDSSVDVIWYTQTTLTFMGMRTPLFLLYGVYHTLFYTSYVVVRRMRFKWWGEAASNGLFVLLLSFPLQVMGTKLLWWQWHDSDPRLENTVYSVPLVSLASYAILATSFNVSLHFLRKKLVHEKYDWKRFVPELSCVVGAALFAVFVSAAQYFLFFYILHDVCQLHSAVPFLLLLCFYACVTMWASLSPRLQDSLYNTGSGKSTEVPLNGRPGDELDELTAVIAIHFLLHMLLTVFSSPKDIVSEGIHQAIGPCDEVEQIFSPFSQALYRNKYFCVEKQRQKQFDFHCFPGGQVPEMVYDEPLEYYALCGTDFENRMEYVSLIWIYCLSVLFVIYYTALCSGSTAPFLVKIDEQALYRHAETQRDLDGRSIFGPALRKHVASRENGHQNGLGIPSGSGKVSDISPDFRHRTKDSRNLNSGGSGKGSRLPTPTRLSSRTFKKLA